MSVRFRLKTKKEWEVERRRQVAFELWTKGYDPLDIIEKLVKKGFKEIEPRVLQQDLALIAAERTSALSEADADDLVAQHEATLRAIERSLHDELERHDEMIRTLENTKIEVDYDTGEVDMPVGMSPVEKIGAIARLSAGRLGIIDRILAVKKERREFYKLAGKQREAAEGDGKGSPRTPSPTNEVIAEAPKRARLAAKRDQLMSPLTARTLAEPVPEDK